MLIEDRKGNKIELIGHDPVIDFCGQNLQVRWMKTKQREILTSIQLQINKCYRISNFRYKAIPNASDTKFDCQTVIIEDTDVDQPKSFTRALQNYNFSSITDFLGMAAGTWISMLPLRTFIPFVFWFCFFYSYTRTCTRDHKCQKYKT